MAASGDRSDRAKPRGGMGIYALAKWFAAAPAEAQKKVSRARSSRSHLRRIARLMPSVGEEIDRLGLPLRVARYVAHGPRAEQSARLALAVAWRGMSEEERRAAPPERRPRL